MIKKLRLKLTLLCSAITICILWCMSAAFLLVSESSQRENAFLSFQADMNSLLTSLEGQNTISHSWLKKMENGKYRIYLLDDGKPVLFNDLTFSPKERLLADTLFSYYKENQEKNFRLSSLHSVHSEFPWSEARSAESSLSTASHYVSCMTWLNNSVPITAVVYAPQHLLQRQFFMQRILFAGLDLAGAILLFAFSYFFTGRLLKPVQENQLRQIEFNASASHELRTPLSVILASVAACEVAPPAEQTHFFAVIRREGKRMQGLISDMLLLANGQSDRIPLSKAWVDLETLLLNQYENFEPLARQKQLSLSIDLPEETLPYWECDEEKISQLLAIFLQNAVSYTPSGGAIRLSLQKTTKRVLLSVSDTGPGIPDAEKKLIFERFYRAEKSRSQKDHFGLGLCIAADIANAHHGVITVKDNHPTGAVFTLALPSASRQGKVTSTLNRSPSR